MAARPHGTKRSLEASEEGEEGDELELEPGVGSDAKQGLLGLHDELELELPDELELELSNKLEESEECDSEDFDVSDECDSDGRLKVIYEVQDSEGRLIGDYDYGESVWKSVKYIVFTYDRDLCDLCLKSESGYRFIDHQLPNVTCNGCNAVFEHRSTTSPFQLWMHSTLKADFQFHRHGGLCSACRAPLPGQTHFEHERVGFVAYKDDPLRDCFPLPDYELLRAVWRFLIPFPKFPKLERKHWLMGTKGYIHIHDSIRSVYNEGRDYMSVAGVEYVSAADDFNQMREPEYREIVPVIKLDYRYWRPKECTCTWTPCECVCIPAQVVNIRRKLNVASKEAAVQEGEEGEEGEEEPMDRRGRRRQAKLYTRLDILESDGEDTHFVYLSGKTGLLTNDDRSATDLEEHVLQIGLGRCYRSDTFKTIHTEACCRRNAVAVSTGLTHHCANLDLFRCGRCPDCTQ